MGWASFYSDTGMFYIQGAFDYAHSYHLQQDRKSLDPPTPHHSSKAAPVNGSPSHSNATAIDLGSHLDTTVFRFECRKSIQIRITPLILPAAVLLEDQMEMKVGAAIYLPINSDECIVRRLSVPNSSLTP